MISVTRNNTFKCIIIIIINVNVARHIIKSSATRRFMVSIHFLDYSKSKNTLRKRKKTLKKLNNICAHVTVSVTSQIAVSVRSQTEISVTCMSDRLV